jgi:hypothetical protein
MLQKHEARHMNKWIPISLLIFGGIFLLTTAHAADAVPPEIQMPGTQPNEVSNFESPDKCDNSLSGYNGTNATGEPQDESATILQQPAMQLQRAVSGMAQQT